MTIDYQADLYDPIYDTIGVSAELTTSAGTAATVTVIDKTTGIAIADKALIETVSPVAMVRAVELTTADIAREQLKDGTITFNGASWRIKSTRPKPSPKGEADGEMMLILLSEG